MTLYNIVDTCNDDELHTEEVTLDQAKAWLIDFWANDDDLSDGEFNALEPAILDCSTAAELNEYMQGIGYALDEKEEN